jgi:imidazole glycerol phosphate synthase subunit HisF
MKLSYFYQKYTEAYGIPVISSNQVTSNGLKRACYVLRFFLSGSNQLKEIFYKRNLRIVVLGSGESVLNVPEYDGLPSGFNLKALSSTIQIPVIATSEENLLCSAGDKLR